MPNNEIWPNPGNESYPLVCEAADLANRLLADVFDNGIDIFDRNDCLRRKQLSATLGYRTEEMKNILRRRKFRQPNDFNPTFEIRLSKNVQRAVSKRLFFYCF